MTGLCEPCSRMDEIREGLRETLDRTAGGADAGWFREGKWGLGMGWWLGGRVGGRTEAFGEELLVGWGKTVPGNQDSSRDSE